jgi:glycosyltransferase involved in cell wall biosynthesis
LNSLKKIVLITSGQPAVNPRLVKEADALSEYYDVTVIYQYWNQWATEADKVLLKSRKWKAIRVGGGPLESKFTFNVTRAIHKLARILAEKISPRFFLAELAICRTSFLLLTKALSIKADLYIGHNPGALAIAALAASFKKVPCGFDAEDFHRNEYSDDPNHPDVKLKKYLEEQYFPLYNYITTASPLISREYQSIFPEMAFHTILNVFSKVQYPPSKVKERKAIKLFWFSQTVGHNRGLQEVVRAMAECESQSLELHILGNPREDVVQKLKSLGKQLALSEARIKFYDPVPPDQIFEIAARCDIGMATEIGVPYNRDLCLTNKIFTYLQAGLAILASDTSAQLRFLKDNDKCGYIFEKSNVESLAKQLKKYVDDANLLEQTKLHNYNLGQQVFNWEKESIKVIRIINQALGQADDQINT